jgi:hypothetical protein
MAWMKALSASGGVWPMMQMRARLIRPCKGFVELSGTDCNSSNISYGKCEKMVLIRRANCTCIARQSTCDNFISDWLVGLFHERRQARDGFKSTTLFRH